MQDPLAEAAAYDLDRFVKAQEGTYPQALAELRAGRKTSHWMWFVFPQLKALGRSEMAKRYGLDGLADTHAYWRHELLGPRLAECCEALLKVSGRGVTEIMGTPDDLKLRSSMTLFQRAVRGEPLFMEVLAKYYQGHEDDATLKLLG